MASSTYEVDKETGDRLITVRVAAEPNDAECLAAIDHLLSSIPYAAQMQDGKQKKDEIVKRWHLLRELQG